MKKQAVPLAILGIIESLLEDLDVIQLGALDLFLQKKGAFYQNRSLWTQEPMAHIVPHWNFKGMEGKMPTTKPTSSTTIHLPKEHSLGEMCFFSFMFVNFLYLVCLFVERMKNPIFCQ